MREGAAAGMPAGRLKDEGAGGAVEGVGGAGVVGKLRSGEGADGLFERCPRPSIVPGRHVGPLPAGMPGARK